MTLHEDIKSSLQNAMKTKNTVKLRVVRGLLTAFVNELVATGKTPQDILTDDEVLIVIKRASKQRKESIAQYQSAGRNELAVPEQEELELLELYLPKMMSQNEIRSIAEAQKSKLGIEDKSKMGILIGAIMKETSQKADGSDVKEVTESLFK